VLVQSEGLPDDPANSIPFYRTARDANRNRQPDARSTVDRARAAQARLPRARMALTRMTRVRVAQARIAEAHMAQALLHATVHSHGEESIAETLSVRIGGVEF
jgi:hypothetical protein